MKTLILWVVFQCGFCTVEANTDFPTVTARKWFCDKTLFLKDFLDDDPHGPCVKVITAPSRFGKSTVIDMVKRFAGIAVDPKGNRLAPDITENYKVFCDPPLKICRNRTFFEKHFGRHPVIHVDYKPLREMIDFKSLIVRFKTVIFQTFEHHVYLAQNASLFLTNKSKELFIDHCDIVGVQKLHDVNIKFALVWLSELLHEHFNRKVIVLLDEYDSFCNSLLLMKGNKTDEIIRFFTSHSGNLFQINPHLYNALLTGVLRVKGVGASPSGPTGNRVQDYRFLDNHKFSSYYGITQEEVSELIHRNIEDDTIRLETLEVIKSYYDGYFIQEQNTTLYSMGSVMEFLEHNVIPNDACFRNQYIDTLRAIFKITKISQIINKLLQGESCRAPIARPLSRSGIAILNRMNRKLKVNREYEIQLFFILLFDLGYLTPVATGSDENMRPLKISNLDVQMEFADIMTENYKNRYSFIAKNIENYQDAFNYFSPRKDCTAAFRNFFRTVHELFNNSTKHPCSNDVQSALLDFAAVHFPIGNTSAFEFKTKHKDETYGTRRKELGTKTNRERTSVVVINNHRMAIFIKTKFQQIKKRKEKVKNKKISVRELAKCAHKQILATSHQFINNTNSILKFTNLSGAVYIGLGFDKDTRDISIACSKSTSEKLTIVLP